MSFSEALPIGWINRLTPSGAKPADTFADAIEDAELLLIHGAASGVAVPPELSQPILAAQSANRNGGQADAAIRGAFYDAYARLAKQFGDVTAETIRDASSSATKWSLRRNRWMAVLLTGLIACVSVTTFVADNLSSGIVEDVASGNSEAVRLRAALTSAPGSASIDPIYGRQDPCTLINEPPANGVPAALSVADIESLQHFALVIRNLHNHALKLNRLIARLGMIECDPLGACVDPTHIVPSGAEARARTQIEPAILDYRAEVLCKIETFQTIRGFATNVRYDYAALMGGIAAYALPIAYSLLGAFAFRLRLFADTIRRRTYHPSFADSARMITAVIAGAIVGLFNPAQGTALSPLATAFLAGYGVELFFKFLDTLIRAFGNQGAKPAE